MKVRVLKEKYDLDAGEDIYSESGREQLVEDDEIDSFEEAFMNGYEEAG